MVVLTAGHMCCCQTFDPAALSHMHMHGGCRVNPIRASGTSLPWQDVGEGAGLDWTSTRAHTRLRVGRVALWPLSLVLGAWVLGNHAALCQCRRPWRPSSGAVARFGVGCPFGLVESRCTSAKEVRAEGWWLGLVGASTKPRAGAVPGPDSASWPSDPPLVRILAVYARLVAGLGDFEGLPGSGHAKLGPIEPAGVCGLFPLLGSPPPPEL